MREGWIQLLDDIRFFGIAISVPMPEPRALAAPGAEPWRMSVYGAWI